jgi:hypothetical protein
MKTGSQVAPETGNDSVPEKGEHAMYVILTPELIR